MADSARGPLMATEGRVRSTEPSTLHSSRVPRVFFWKAVNYSLQACCLMHLSTGDAPNERNYNAWRFSGFWVHR